MYKHIGDANKVSDNDINTETDEHTGHLKVFKTMYQKFDSVASYSKVGKLDRKNNVFNPNPNIRKSSILCAVKLTLTCKYVF